MRDPQAPLLQSLLPAISVSLANKHGYGALAEAPAIKAVITKLQLPSDEVLMAEQICHGIDLLYKKGEKKDIDYMITRLVSLVQNMSDERRHKSTLAASTKVGLAGAGVLATSHTLPIDDNLKAVVAVVGAAGIFLGAIGIRMGSAPGSQRREEYERDLGCFAREVENAKLKVAAAEEEISRGSGRSVEQEKQKEALKKLYSDLDGLKTVHLPATSLGKRQAKVYRASHAMVALDNLANQ